MANIEGTDDKPICFVVMGYEKKTDPFTSKVYDLDKSYRSVIKKAVEAAGFVPVRSDMVMKPGHISRQMYKLLMDAELVVCDLTTLNVNAVFELGVRMAFRPKATVVIASEETKIPFNLNQERLFRYKHGGEVIDYEDAEAAQSMLTQACREASTGAEPDSLIYSLFHKELEPPRWRGTSGAASNALADTPLEDPREFVWQAKQKKDWAGLIERLKTLHRDAAAEKRPLDAFFTQQWALATYKQQETKDIPGLEALKAARAILERLEPGRSTDAETLGLWAAIHKRLAEHPSRDAASRKLDLDVAIASYQKGYVLRNDHYNGANFGFLMLRRAVEFADSDARRNLRDRVESEDTFRRVIEFCKGELELPVQVDDEVLSPERRDLLENQFWRTASLALALLAAGDSRYDEARTRLGRLEQRLNPDPSKSWMVATTDNQEQALRALLQAAAQPQPSTESK